MGKVINELYAFVSVDPEDDDEGVIAFQTDDGWMPMIGADMERVESLKAIADQMVEELGIKYEIRYFSLDVDVEHY
jgi:hypothetical protein